MDHLVRKGLLKAYPYEGYTTQIRPKGFLFFFFQKRERLVFSSTTKQQRKTLCTKPSTQIALGEFVFMKDLKNFEILSPSNFQKSPNKTEREQRKKNFYVRI